MDIAVHSVLAIKSIRSVVMNCMKYVAQHGLHERSDGADHAGTKARVLTQDRGQESRARARQAGNEVDCCFHLVPPIHGALSKLSQARPHRQTKLQFRFCQPAPALIRRTISWTMREITRRQDGKGMFIVDRATGAIVCRALHSKGVLDGAMS